MRSLSRSHASNRWARSRCSAETGCGKTHGPTWKLSVSSQSGVLKSAPRSTSSPGFLCSRRSSRELRKA
eukprot:9227724-Prorocentrum_lima.AAC.1